MVCVNQELSNLSGGLQRATAGRLGPGLLRLRLRRRVADHQHPARGRHSPLTTAFRARSRWSSLPAVGRQRTRGEGWFSRHRRGQHAHGRFGASESAPPNRKRRPAMIRPCGAQVQKNAAAFVLGEAGEGESAEFAAPVTACPACGAPHPPTTAIVGGRHGTGLRPGEASGCLGSEAGRSGRWPPFSPPNRRISTGGRNWRPHQTSPAEWPPAVRAGAVFGAR